VHEIGVRIVDGELQPGRRFPTTASSSERGVSRTVVREAIKVLAAKGSSSPGRRSAPASRPRRDWNLLDPTSSPGRSKPGRRRIPRAGARAAPHDRAGRRAPARPSAHATSQIAALYEAYEEMAAAGDDLDAFMAPDLRFHSLLLEACGNELLEHMTRSSRPSCARSSPTRRAARASYPRRRAAPGDRARRSRP
jgi:DNA-binding FadR family transcriptional regulator